MKLATHKHTSAENISSCLQKIIIIYTTIILCWAYMPLNILFRNREDSICTTINLVIEFLILVCLNTHLSNEIVFKSLYP